MAFKVVVALDFNIQKVLGLQSKGWKQQTLNITCTGIFARIIFHLSNKKIVYTEICCHIYRISFL